MKMPLFKKFRLGEVLQYLDHVLTICESHNAEALKIDSLVKALCEANTNLHNVCNRKRGSSLTAQIKNLDKLRGKCLIGIKKNVESYTYHFNPEVSTPAAMLLNSIELLGKDIPKRNLHAETYIINKLLGSWSKNAKYAEAVNTLRLTEWAAELKQLNDRFSNIDIQRVKESNRQPVGITRIKRKAAIAAFRKTLATINAHLILSTDNKYVALVNELDKLTQSFNNVVRTRKGKGAS